MGADGLCKMGLKVDILYPASRTPPLTSHHTVFLPPPYWRKQDRCGNQVMGKQQQTHYSDPRLQTAYTGSKVIDCSVNQALSRSQ